MTSRKEPDRIPLDLDRIGRLSNFLSAAQQIAEDYTQADQTWAGLPGSKAATEAVDPAASAALLYELNGAYAFAQLRLLVSWSMPSRLPPCALSRLVHQVRWPLTF